MTKKTNRNTQLVELQEFKKGKRQVYVDFVNRVVRWKNETYQISYKNVGGTKYPYVVVENIRPWSEIKSLVKQITTNDAKRFLKNVEYEMNGHFYFVIGIGPDAIKVLIDDSDEPEFLRYLTTDGQQLLDILVSTLGQSVLLVDE